MDAWNHPPKKQRIAKRVTKIKEAGITSGLLHEWPILLMEAVKLTAIKRHVFLVLIREDTDRDDFGINTLFEAIRFFRLHDILVGIVHVKDYLKM